MLLNLKGSRWKGMRSQLTPAFTSGKLKTMEHLIDVCCNNMSEFLNENIKSGNYIVIFINIQTFYKCLKPISLAFGLMFHIRNRI
jgi:hypothetical protein